MAKSNTIQIRLVSSAETGYFYVTKKNVRNSTGKLEMKKYEPDPKKAWDKKKLEQERAIVEGISTNIDQMGGPKNLSKNVKIVVMIMVDEAATPYAAARLLDVRKIRTKAMVATNNNRLIGEIFWLL